MSKPKIFFIVLSYFLIANLKAKIDYGDIINKVSNNPIWLRLNQTDERKHVSGSLYESRIKKLGFFLSWETLKDPPKYWDSKREASQFLHFLKNEKLAIAKWKRPLYCLSPARSKWITDQFDIGLKLDQKAFHKCPLLKHYLQDKAADSLSYLYIGAYITNPASIMGHGLLLLKDKTKSYVINNAVDYSAIVPSDAGPITYAINGMAGGFPGRFAVTPLFTKLKTYLKLENRDLWDFELELTKEEVFMANLAIYELRSKAIFEYYFFDQNCGMLLLSIVDIVRPELNLIQELPVIVLPNRIPSLLKRKKLIRSINYRPSYKEKLVRSFKELTHKDQVKLRKIIKINEVASPIKDLANTLLEYLDYRSSKKGKLSQKEEKLFNEVALYFIERGITLPKNKKPTPLTSKDAPPLTSHDLFYVQTSLGRQKRGDEKNYVDLTLRPFTHDLTESDAGYVKYSEIHFLKANFRLRESEKPILQRLDLMTFSQVPPEMPFESISSFATQLRMRQRFLSNCTNCLGLSLDGSYGKAFDFQKRLYSLYARARIILGHKFLAEDSLQYLAGPDLGMLLNIGEHSKLHLFYSPLFNHNKQRGLHQVKATLGLSVKQNYRINLDYEYLKAFDSQLNESQSDLKVGLSYYF